MLRLHKSRQQAFTLIELLISVVLMMILVGAVVMVFMHSSEVVTLAEAKTEVYQNARVIFDTIGRDLASIQANNTPTLYLYSASLGTYFLGCETLTSWGTDSGVATVEYELVTVVNANSNVINLQRNLKPGGVSTGNAFVSSILGQYVYSPSSSPRLQIEFYNNGGDSDPTTGSFTGVTTNNFNNANMPSAVRVTMDLTDRRAKVIRTFSRVFWIPCGR